jgi:hypothetical protein
MLHATRAGQQFRQLPMFMSAREIRNQYQAIDGDRSDTHPLRPHPRPENFDKWIENDDQLFNRKYEESWAPNRKVSSGRTLGDDILKHGVENPVSLQVDLEKTGSAKKPEILGGHHRLAVMGVHKPDELMPVEHFKDSYEAGTSLGPRY